MFGTLPADSFIALTNTGTATLNWGSTFVATYSATFVPDSGSLAPSASVTLTVSYLGSTAIGSTSSPYAGTFTILDPSASNSPQSVAISRSVLFSPLELPTATMWVDADDAATVTVGTSNLISQWDNKANPSKNFTQSVSAEQPRYDSSVINGRNAVYFQNTANQIMRGSTNWVQSQYTFALVARNFTAIATNGAQYGIFSLSSASTNRLYLMYGAAVTAGDRTEHLVNSGGGNVRTGTNSNYAAGTDTIFMIKLSSATLMLYIGGSLFTNSGTLDGASFSPNNELVLGARFGTSLTSYLDGYIAEYLVYNTALTSAQMNTLGGYLSTKWGASWANV
jgi:hypothetical protein